MYTISRDYRKEIIIEKPKEDKEIKKINFLSNYAIIDYCITLIASEIVFSIASLPYLSTSALSFAP